MTGRSRVVVVGGGHNGLVGACYLARAGVDVVVLEASDRLGGGSRTEELVPGYRFDTHSATHPRVALLDLLNPPLGGTEARRLRAASQSNGVQMVVHLAVDRLPACPGARPGDWNGLQSFVDSLEDLSDGFAQAQAGHLPRDPVPTYAFTPSALDGSLAPPGQHTVYLACPTAPARLPGGWDAVAEDFADRVVATVEARAPGFTASVTGRSVRTPEVMQRELRWAGAHPMYLDLGLHQSGPLRPTPALARHTTPVPGLVGAGTGPVGGIAGTPGRAAARALLRHLPR